VLEARAYEVLEDLEGCPFLDWGSVHADPVSEPEMKLDVKSASTVVDLLVVI
jgi:hypothetical protein